MKENNFGKIRLRTNPKPTQIMTVTNVVTKSSIIYPPLYTFIGIKCRLYTFITKGCTKG